MYECHTRDLCQAIWNIGSHNLRVEDGAPSCGITITVWGLHLMMIFLGGIHTPYKVKISKVHWLSLLGHVLLIPETHTILPVSKLVRAMMFLLLLLLRDTKFTNMCSLNHHTLQMNYCVLVERLRIFYADACLSMNMTMSCGVVNNEEENKS